MAGLSAKKKPETSDDKKKIKNTLKFQHNVNEKKNNIQMTTSNMYVVLVYVFISMFASTLKWNDDVTYTTNLCIYLLYYISYK